LLVSSTRLDIRRIKKITNLIVLFCSNNKLTSLNGIENLINLKDLYCSSNDVEFDKDEILRKIKNGESK
jgi:Leucine-rich repeat (LRR) protein